MIILDTNVVSEPFKLRPDLRVRAWLDAQSATSLFICSPVLAELRFGVERLAAGLRKDRLQANIDRIEYDLYGGRILPLDTAAANEYGRTAAKRERMGHRMEQMDALIAAIALTHHFVLATRDTRDFADLGLELINPFRPSVPAR